MSSSDFQTVLIQDDRIANLTDKIHYSVNKGAQQITSSSTGLRRACQVLFSTFQFHR